MIESFNNCRSNRSYKLSISVSTGCQNLYKCASTLVPPNINIDNKSQNADPLIELANKTHIIWKHGECSTAERNTIREETIEHLKKCAVSKERKAWADVLSDRNPKVVWDKINWKGTFDKHHLQ